jgi:hypothetical protein
MRPAVSRVMMPSVAVSKIRRSSSAVGADLSSGWGGSASGSLRPGVGSAAGGQAGAAVGSSPPWRSAERQLGDIHVKPGESGRQVASRLHIRWVGIAEQVGGGAIGMNHPAADEQNDAGVGEIERAPNDVGYEGVGRRRRRD